MAAVTRRGSLGGERHLARSTALGRVQGPRAALPWPQGTSDGSRFEPCAVRCGATRGGARFKGGKAVRSTGAERNMPKLCVFLWERSFVGGVG